MQIILIYNIYQILKQTNFYFLFSYFMLCIIYFGIFLIIYDFDLNCVIIWIIYGGLGIIFFTYSLMWFEIFKNSYKYLKIHTNIYYIFIIIYLILNIKIEKLSFFLQNNFYINFYLINSKNNIQELELMGWGIIYYSSFLFILLSYFLLINCFIILIIIINVKKIKNNNLNYYYIIFLKNNNLYYFNIIKNQHLYIQDYENVYQKNSNIKNFKITNYFHQIKNIKRRV